MNFLVAIEKGESNYAAYIPNLPGCTSTGDNLEELITNIKEAIVGHIEVMREFNEPLPKESLLCELTGSPQYVVVVNVEDQQSKSVVAA
jgi:predicted RNase H-like HicB family nuclease